MRKLLRCLIIAVFAAMSSISFAQEGKCGDKVKWTFDGMELKIMYEGTDTYGSSINDYTKSSPAPWIKKGLAKKIRKVHIGYGINRIGAFAFYNCERLKNVEFESSEIKSIGSGAFFGCSSLLNFYFPIKTSKIERLAFANCTKLGAVDIPENCTVEDYAFMSCPNISNIIVPANTHIGEQTFLSEQVIGGKKCFVLYGGEIQTLPSYITVANSKKYGLSPESVASYIKKKNITEPITSTEETFVAQSDVDSLIPETDVQHTNTFALIFGNEDYTQVSKVPFAKADARVFREYCVKTLGIPSQNVIYSQNATLNEMKRNMSQLGNRVDVRSDGGEEVNVLVYYAGHGVPDEFSHDAYLLPIDGYASDVTTGMSLNAFYTALRSFKAKNVTVFLDACFSGSQRGSNNIVADRGKEGTRGVAIRPKEANLGDNMVVFSAAQGVETAQPYTEQGHGLFTYYLLKKLQDSQGMLSYGRLADYIYQNVRETAVSNGKSQTPTTTASPALGDEWRKWKF